MSTVTPPVADGTNFLLQSRQDEIKGQADAFNHLDSKTGVILGFAFVAVVQLLASVFRSNATEQSIITAHPWICRLLIGPAFICTIAGAVFGLLALWPRPFHYGVSVDELASKSTGACEDEYKKQALDMLKCAYCRNTSTLEMKAKFAGFTSRSIFVALIFLVLAALLLFIPVR